MKTPGFIIILFVALLSIQGIAQNRWMKVYHDDDDAPKLFLTESYDHGYLLMGRIDWPYPRYNWLIKTDINGNILWEKTIGDGINVIDIYGIELNKYNDTYLTGVRGLVGDYPDPMIIKLNKCGEKEWCKIFSTPGNSDKMQGLCVTKDGGCAAILVDGTLNDKDYLVRFSKEGELLWMYYYPPTTGHTGMEHPTNLILTPDDGFLMTGFCYYSNPWDTLGYLSPYYIKADSMGNFEWELVAGLHPNNIGGKAHATVIGPDSTYFYSSISHYYRDGIGDAPGLLKMDMNGQMDTVYDLSDPGYYGILDDARFISDTTLIASADWDKHPYPKAVVIDTLGHILCEQDLVDEIYMASVRVTFDNKALFYTMKYFDNEDQWDTYLFKLNQHLESDTLYTYPFKYDTLCPYPIASDTIVPDDCGLIVGTTEWPDINTQTNTTDALEVFPNPAYGEIHCKYRILERSGNPDLSGQNTELTISLYDIWGRLVESVEIPTGQSHIRIDVSNYTPGVYFVVLKSDGQVLGRKKVVVCD